MGPGARLSQQAIIEVKGVRITPNVYPVLTRATDSRATKIPKEYRKKAHQIDLALCPADTRPLDSAQALPMGPFERALGDFVPHGGPIPVVFGGFGEFNAGFNDLIKLAAKRAAATPYGRRLAPVRSGSEMGSRAMLTNKFRMAISNLCWRENMKLSLSRLHLLGTNPAEANTLAENASPNRPRWNPNTDCPSWFAKNYNRSNYQAYYEFRQSRHHYSRTSHV